jgi:hypothetical protein
MIPGSSPGTAMTGLRLAVSAEWSGGRTQGIGWRAGSDRLCGIILHCSSTARRSTVLAGAPAATGIGSTVLRVNMDGWW